jgi:parallel beta-helix repeat protein
MRIALVTTVVLVMAAVGVGDSHAVTWYINEAGTGDAPNIETAMALAAPGDTILVGPGTYETHVRMTDGVVLISEMGPEVTILSAAVYLPPIVTFGSGVSGSVEGFTLTGIPEQCCSIQPTIDCSEAGEFLISGNLIHGNHGSGISCFRCPTGTIRGNTIADNVHQAIVLLESSVEVLNNCCVGNLFGLYLWDVTAAVACNNCWGNSIDNYFCSGGCEGNPYFYGNITQNPHFCDRPNDNYTLRSCSPCFPWNHPQGADCELIGALGQGCDLPSSVEPTSWGTVKTMFR